MRARDKSDNDIRFAKHDKQIEGNTVVIDEHSTHFDTIAKSIAMIIENINM